MKFAPGVALYEPERDFVHTLFEEVEYAFEDTYSVEAVCTGGLNKDVSPPEWHHLNGYAFDFRIKDVPYGDRYPACLFVATRLFRIDPRYRVILFSARVKYWVTMSVEMDLNSHPDHVHIVLWQR